MARSKPIPRKVRQDLHTPSIRTDYNRGKILRRDKDEQPNISNSIMDMDKAIMYYFNEVIKPTVIDNGETVKVPVMYASPERWYAIQRNGFMRDKRQQLIVPVIAFRRTSMEKNENIDSKAQEVFVFAPTREDADKVYDLNDLDSRMKLKQRQQFLQARKKVEAKDMPDTQIDLRRQQVEEYKSKFRKG